MKFYQIFQNTLSLIIAMWVFSSGIANGATLFDVYKMAIQNNPHWANFRAETDQSTAQRDIGRSSLKPQIGFVSAYGYTWLDSENAQVPTLTNAQFTDLNQCLINNNDYNFCLGQVSSTNCTEEPACLIAENGSSQTIQQTQIGIQLTQPLYAPEYWHQAIQSDIKLQQAQNLQRYNEQQFLQTLIEAYLGALSSREESETLNQALATQQQQVTWLEKSFENGLATADSVLYARALYSLQKAQAEQHERRSLVAFSALESVTQQPVTSLSNIDQTIPMPPPNPQSPEEWIQLAHQQNPLLKQLELAIDIAASEIDKRQGQRKPKVSLTAGLGTSFADNDSSLSDNTQTTTANISLEMNMPLYAGGALTARVREAASLQQLAELKLATSRIQIEKEIRDSFSLAAGGLRHLQLLEKALEALELQVQNLEQAFEKGVKDATTLLDARQKLFDTQQQRLIARFNYIRASIALKQLAGVLNEQDIMVIASWSDGSEQNQTKQTLFDQAKPWLSY